MDIPTAPYHNYKGKGWTSWDDWLGKAPRFLPFAEARDYARRLNLTSSTEWAAHVNAGKIPANVPRVPQSAYKDKGWISWHDWLGRTTYRPPPPGGWRSFVRARAFARKLGLKSMAEWRHFCEGVLPGKQRIPADIPFHPAHAYKDAGWRGANDWLGKKSK